MFSFILRPEGAHGFGVAFSDREGGVTPGTMGPLNLGRTDVDDLAHVRENHDRVRRDLDVDRVITVSQVHGPDVVVVDEELVAGWADDQHLGSAATGRSLTHADALVTDQPRTALCIRVADCLPAVVVDADRRVVGAAHAGRVGLAAGVLPATIEAMRALGARDLQAWIGPHICGGCYEVPDQMRAEVAAGLPGAYAETTWGTPALDLGEAAHRQLEVLGCRVTRVAPCTREDERLHSHRRDGAQAGRLAAYAWLA
ncbi:peptidoglycan editing factor PgeF [Mariniluteicoccus endophyticus]